MKYNPKIHHRRSIRKKGYDYSSAGFYFVTICCKNRAHLYGRVENNKMLLNDAGLMIDKWYWELENKYPDIRCQEMVIMPNHFHCIIENTGQSAASAAAAVRADLRVCPPPGMGETSVSGTGETDVPSTGETAVPSTDGISQTINNLSSDNLSDDLSDDLLGVDLLGELGEHVGMGEHVGSPLPRVLQWFKTMTTNEYIRGVKSLGWERFDGKMWQRNYWEHIIRNEQSHRRIAKYIIDNPKNWKGDKFR